MPIVVVEVMPKAELLDPQGKAVSQALARTTSLRGCGVRVGKRFELDIPGDIGEAEFVKIEEIAREFLANQVIEDVVAVYQLRSPNGVGTRAGRPGRVAE